MRVYSRLAAKGITTLTLLILLSSVLTMILLFNDDMLRSHTALTWQRTIYVKDSFYLQQLSQAQKAHICDGLSLQSDDSVSRVDFVDEQRSDSLRQFMWCKRQALFKKAPRVGLNEGLFTEFIDTTYLADFRARLFPPPMPLPKDRNDYFYWFPETEAEWVLNGNIYAVVVAEGNLTITGKGRISGAVITKGNLLKDDAVQIAYRRATVTNITQTYSRWKRAENSWNDFNPD